ncbi:MAG: GyrI-like domain-containing protein [Bacteroidales bacterium]|jgi:hypothetical protein|nr:GyrI-like domain-containing protein [Bacteroidales bacterium]
MSSVKKIIIWIITLAIIFAGLYAYFGGFNKIEIKTLNYGGEKIISKPLKGDISAVGELSNSIAEELSSEYDITNYKKVVIYYNNQEDEASNLKADVGCLAEDVSHNRLEQASKTFELKTIPKREYLVIEFPYRGYFSSIIGKRRVYPKIEEYLLNNNYAENTPLIEIYDSEKGIITYRKALKKK